MDATDQKLLDLLLEGALSGEIRQTTHYTEKQLLIKLSKLLSKGYNLGRKYYSDGSIGHYIDNQMPSDKIPFSVITKPDEKQIKVMLISDLHIGNIKENFEYIYLIYDYCIANNIHIIFNGGDLIDGKLIGNGHKLIYNYKKQINRVLTKHPHDKGIINFIGLGNHDLDSVVNAGIDLVPILLNSREDLVPVGYGYGVVHIKNELFPIRHKIKNFTRIKQSCAVISNGHSHKNRISCHYTAPNTAFKVNVFIASLSDIPMGNPTIHPGAMTMDLTFGDNGYVKSSDFTFLDVGDSITVSGEKSINFNRDYVNKKTEISFEENYKQKVLKKELF